MRNDSPNAAWAFRALATSLFILFVLLVIASFLPDKRLWGINHLAFFPLPVRLAGLGLIALSFIPVIARLFYAGAAGVVDLVTGGSKRGWVVSGLAILALVCLLFVLRVDVHLMNEGRFLAPLISLDAQTGGQTTVTIPEVLSNERLARGTMVLYLVASKISMAVSDRGMAGGILILNLLLFAMFALSLIRFTVSSNMKPPLAVILLLVTLFSGTLVLFSGYLTKYAPFLIVSSLYILSALRFLDKRGGLKAPVIYFILAFIMHVFGALLLPSLLYLLFHRIRGQRLTQQHMQIVYALFIVTAGLALAGTLSPQYRSIYLPLLGSDTTDGVLSPGHIVDICNILLLMLPALPLLLSVPLINRRLRAVSARAPGSGDTPQEGRRARLILESHYATLLLLPWALFLLLMKPETSFARGWDRSILAALGVLPFAMIGLKQLFELTGTTPGGKERGSSAIFVSPAIAVTLVLTLSWIGLNSSPVKSEARFESLLAFEKGSAAPGYRQLSFYYSNQGKMLKAGRASERAFAIDPSPLHSYDLSMLRLAEADTLGAIDLLTQSLEQHPDAHTNRHQLITLLDKSARYRELIEVCKEGIIQEPSEPQYYYFLGKSHLYAGNIREGVDALRTCSEMNPPQPVLNNIEALMRRLRKKQ